MAGRNYKFIVLEGIDGAGKSTVSRKLASRIGAELLRTPPPGFGGTRRIIDSRAELPSRFLFYLSSVVYASELIRKLLDRNHVVCDRYLVTTLAYHRAMGLKLHVDIQELNLVEPDFTFFLELRDENERQRRMLERGRYTSTDAILDDQRTRNRLLREYRNYSMITVDTSQATVEKVVEHIRSHVGL